MLSAFFFTFCLHFSIYCITFALAKLQTSIPTLLQGEVLEWLKRHAWKACNRQNRFAGSNPVLSAGFKAPR